MLNSPSAISNPWTGDPRRVILRQELAARSVTIANLYWEAIRILEDGANPERYSICFYLLRELQDLMPKHWPGIPQSERRMVGGVVLDWIADRLDVFAVAPRVDAGGRWTGPIAGEFSKFLRKLRAKMIQYRGENPRWATVQRTTLVTVDPGMAGLPEDVQDELVKRWSNLKDRFNAGTHHGPIDPVRYDATVRDFEAFLGDRLIPPTIAHEDRLLALIEQAEA